MKLESVVPWGRSFAEYEAMFNLTREDLQKNILGCADGPASFNAEMTERGAQVISADPIYQFSRAEIDQRVAEVYPKILAETKANADDFIWQKIKSPEELGKVRMAAMARFLDDYENGITEGRYVGASLPFLPFEPKQFQLALCSHYLFLYSDQVDETAHVKAVNELCRVADEVRIYPLITLGGEPSSHLDAVIKALNNYGVDARFEQTNAQFQKGATQMLVLNSADSIV